MEIIQYLGFENCIRLTNGEIEIIASTDFGPRILAYNFIGSENVLGIHQDAEVKTELGTFKPYGGHRLWIAPENMPKTYTPDNSPVEYFFDDSKNSLRLVQPLEQISNTQKEFTITLGKTGSGVSIDHKITNLGEKEIEISAWALTVMRGGGEVFIPNEPFAPYGDETLLPVRNLSVWSYTNLSDSRWLFDSNFIRLKVEADKPEPQKIGVLNKQGRLKYKLENVEFTKNFKYKKTAVYPDMNSNVEVYTAGSFVEIETLSPLKNLSLGDKIEYSEKWNLGKIYTLHT